MTDQEFEIEQKSILSTVPKTFRATLAYMAYEKGHSAGNSEVILLLKELVESLSPAIRQYKVDLIGYN